MGVDLLHKAIAPRRRVAKGPKRPQYLKNQELDRFMMMFTALLGEVSAIRERLDTHEALGEVRTTVSRGSVEAYRLSLREQEEREAARDSLMKRLLRIIPEELEEVRGTFTTRDLKEVLAADGTSLAQHEQGNR